MRAHLPPPPASRTPSMPCDIPTGLLVFGLGEVVRARVFRPDAVLSLLSPGQEAPRFDGAQLVLRMEDVEDDSPGSPTAAHATLIAAFLAAPAGRVAIHCHAGVSRSAAAALACLHLRGLPPKALAPTLQALRPQARPNRRLARLLDQALGLPGILAAAAQRLHGPQPAT